MHSVLRYFYHSQRSVQFRSNVLSYATFSPMHISLSHFKPSILFRHELLKCSTIAAAPSFTSILPLSRIDKRRLFLKRPCRSSSARCTSELMVAKWCVLKALSVNISATGGSACLRRDCEVYRALVGRPYPTNCLFNGQEGQPHGGP
jgi:hypothetical protein